ncbi:Solute carrier family 35 member B1 [Tritrichomonas foetus]|uniref:Solute carrier family 35 member B1 n=1 Tax=Tritrichomonas foetus TaxID=1144522 RepID=A0A1J4KIE1_9EUKA|nr:Solute carrier family 35 member B1 [Tritrichomonas foetus]|eukprot:OHT10995.1 Solute carrier family 35 member B1 [Tritrichomonas foetus]
MFFSKKVKLGIAIAIMYVSFLLYFMLHEELLPKKNASSDSFSYPNALIFFNDICYMLAAFIAVLITKAQLPKNPFPFIAISLPQQAGMACVNYAHKYVNYPTFQVMKAAKPMSVMLCKLLIFHQRIDIKTIYVVILLSIGLIIFGVNCHFESKSYIGVLYACGALFCDAIYVPIVDKLKVGNGGPFVTMFYNYMWSTLIVFILRFTEIFDAVFWIFKHQKEFLPKLLLFGVTGSIGQISLFAAIGLSDGLVLSIATTTRKLVTIVLSSIVFGHNLNSRQWLGVGIVFTALGIEIFFKSKKKVKIEQSDALDVREKI